MEFYQLEFQCVYSPDTKNDYSTALIPCIKLAIAELIGPCHVTPSDRLPSYAAWTQDIICSEIDMEVCSISLRTDFANAQVLEVAVGTDRYVYNMIRRREQLAKIA